jgi:hypothetical protein
VILLNTYASVSWKEKSLLKLLGDTEINGLNTGSHSAFAQETSLSQIFPGYSRSEPTWDNEV